MKNRKFTEPFALIAALALAGSAFAADSSITIRTADSPYGTIMADNEAVATRADTSSSIVVDWRGAEIARAESPTFAKEQLIFKETVRTDGDQAGEPMSLKMTVLYHAAPKAPSPCVVFIPGGGFLRADPENSLPDTRAWLAERGFAVASCQYRVVGEGLYKDAVADVNDAIRYIRANAERFNIDPARLALMGNSAGGYMAALTSLSSPEGDFRGDNNLDYPTGVSCVIDLYGVGDMTQIGADYTEESIAAHHSPFSSESQYVNGARSGRGVMDNPEEAAKASPVAYAGGRKIPFLIMHGDEDLLVSPSQTLKLHEALRAAGGDSTRYSLTGDGHGKGGFLTVPAHEAMAAFLDTWLGSEK